jgi:hypothetical protein
VSNSDNNRRARTGLSLLRTACKGSLIKWGLTCVLACTPYPGDVPVGVRVGQQPFASRQVMWDGPT